MNKKEQIKLCLAIIESNYPNLTNKELLPLVQKFDIECTLEDIEEIRLIEIEDSILQSRNLGIMY